MIKLFHQLRHQSVKNGSFRTYLPYVIGEIVLVVAGILIALSINNWSERKKERALEIKLLRELKEDIEQNRSDFQFNIELREQSIQSINTIIRVIRTTKPYHDSLDFHFGNMANTSIMSLNTASFEAIKSAGLTCISNDVLRKSITNFYEVSTSYLNKIEREHEAQQLTPRWTDYLLGHFHNTDMGQSSTPNDYMDIIGDAMFRELLHMTLYYQEMIKDNYEVMDYQASTIYSLIDLELNPEY